MIRRGKSGPRQSRPWLVSAVVGQTESRRRNRTSKGRTGGWLGGGCGDRVGALRVGELGWVDVAVQELLVPREAQTPDAGLSPRQGEPTPISTPSDSSPSLNPFTCTSDPLETPSAATRVARHWCTPGVCWCFVVENRKLKQWKARPWITQQHSLWLQCTSLWPTALLYLCTDRRTGREGDAPALLAFEDSSAGSKAFSSFQNNSKRIGGAAAFLG